jgi:hypothetical protein
VNDLVGLLELPHRNGWVDFSYSRGDRVGSLKETVDAHWGAIDSIDAALLRKYRGAWATFAKSWTIFCKQQDGSYRVLRNRDLIPTSPPAGAGANAYEYWVQENPGILDVRDDDSNWKAGPKATIKPRPNLQVRFRIPRTYTLPPEEGYAVQLLALITLTGG